MNISSKNEKLFHSRKSDVFCKRTKSANYEQIVDKLLALRYNDRVFISKIA